MFIFFICLQIFSHFYFDSHLSELFFSVWALWDRPWVGNTFHCWYNYPFHQLGENESMGFHENRDHDVNPLPIIHYRICLSVLNQISFRHWAPNCSFDPIFFCRFSCIIFLQIQQFGGTTCSRWRSTGPSWWPSSRTWSEKTSGRCSSTTLPPWLFSPSAGATRCIGWAPWSSWCTTWPTTGWSWPSCANMPDMRWRHQKLIVKLSSTWFSEQKCCDIAFVIFCLTWTYSRIGIFPTWIIYSTTSEAAQVLI